MSLEKEKMDAGELYNPGDPEILEEQFYYLNLLYDFNQTRPSELEKRQSLLKQMFGKIEKGCYIEPPLRSNFGGHHCYFGKNIYANFNLTLVDDGPIYVGDYTMFGPNVSVLTASHPIIPELRKKGIEFNKPVHIGSCCWIGAGVIIMPGVSIGDDSIIGAGSVVTKDIPSHVIAFGNPCKVYRPIGEEDYLYYDIKNKKKIDWDHQFQDKHDSI